MFPQEPTVQTIFNNWLWYTHMEKCLLTDVNNYWHLTNDFIHYVNETNKQTSNFIWLTIDRSKPTIDWPTISKLTNHFQMDQISNTIDWQTLLTWITIVQLTYILTNNTYTNTTVNICTKNTYNTYRYMH